MLPDPPSLVCLCKLDIHVTPLLKILATGLLIKVHYKVIEILAVRWFGTKLMQTFKETTTSNKS